MLKCVLFDSNIVIEAYRLGIWEKLIKRVEISVSSIVSHTESLFYVRKEFMRSSNMREMTKPFRNVFCPDHGYCLSTMACDMGFPGFSCVTDICHLRQRSGSGD